jgi:peptide/nickel transport system ATP-binding protein
MAQMKKEEIFRINNLKKWFLAKSGFFWGKSTYIKAVDGISFKINKGEIFGLVGESGCGKTTTGKVILRLIDKTSGDVFFKNQDIFKLKKEKLRKLRRRIQIVFQNPYEVLESRLNVYKLLSEPLEFHDITLSKNEKVEKIKEILFDVDMKPPKEFLYKYPHELSGGQLQRIAIARSLILQPEFIVMDEPVSMLDISIRAGILKLLLKLKRELGLTYLFITHDLAVSKFVCDRLAVMYLGKIVEVGRSEKVLNEPLHPYTKALRAVLPILDPDRRHYRDVSKVIRGEISSPINIPPGCRFHPRCPYAKSICSKIDPTFIDFKERSVACHLYSA